MGSGTGRGALRRYRSRVCDKRGLFQTLLKVKTQELGIRKENSALKKKMQAHYSENIVGDSEPMQSLYEMILKAAGTDDNVIVYGESGTGKELVSRAVHDHSTRINGNFCACKLRCRAGASL